jgi:WhiB family transcriptional regulator, redox-sensing transcriptional regulator
MSKTGEAGEWCAGQCTRDDPKLPQMPKPDAAKGRTAMTHADHDWRSQGACLTADPELFFPLSSMGPALRQLTEAKKVCARCPVRAECLDFALSTHQVHGVWGGTSEDERRRLVAARTRGRRPVMAGAGAGRLR